MRDIAELSSSRFSPIFSPAERFYAIDIDCQRSHAITLAEAGYSQRHFHISPFSLISSPILMTPFQMIS
jgi:hypothetical protein